VNYLMLDRLPRFQDGWQEVVDAMQQGKFFSTTGEVLMQELKINGKLSGETLNLNADGTADINQKPGGTSPMNFVESISGEGEKGVGERSDLANTKARGEEMFAFQPNLSGRKWVRIDAWDCAVNGAFSQTFYLHSVRKKV